MMIQSQSNPSGAWEGWREAFRAGDRVCTGANVHAHHEVIAIYGDKAWLRDLRTGCDGITSLSRCHRA